MPWMLRAAYGLDARFLRHSCAQLRCCLSRAQEIDRCLRLSPRFNFLLLLGDRYGYRPLPDRLDEADHASLLAAIEMSDAGAARLMREWYSLEANSVPPVYMLHTLSDANRATFWDTALPQLAPAMRAAALQLRQAGALSETAFRSIYLSVTEQEVVKGLLEQPDNAAGAACFARSIVGWHAHGSASHRFRDVITPPAGSDAGAPPLVSDEQAAVLRTELRRKAKAFLHPSNYWPHEVQWLPDGSGISTAHVPQLCAQVERFLHERLAAEQAAFVGAGAAQLEVEVHKALALERAAAFVGREPELSRLLAHARRGSGCLVVHASSGAGKSALLGAAYARLCAHEAAMGQQVVPLVRFCGATRAASSAVPLALSLIAELDALATSRGRSDRAHSATGGTASGEQEDEEAASEQGLHALDELRRAATAALERARLACAPARIVLIVDGLDQLLEMEQGAREAALLGWLPSPLPHSVLVLTSLLEQTQPHGGAEAAPADEAAALVARLGGSSLAGTAKPAGGVLRLGSLRTAELPLLIDALLAAHGRSVQAEQRAALVEAARREPLAMFVQLATESACRWPARLRPPPRLPASLADACDEVLVRLERFHGALLLRCALGCVEVAAGGLSELELLDVLGAEGELMADVLQYHQPEPRLFPPIVWLRLRADLKGSLAESASSHGGGGDAPTGGGPTTLRLFHRQLREASRRRYLASDDDRAARARAIATTFGAKLDKKGDRDFSQLVGAAAVGDGSVPDPAGVQRALRAASRQLQSLLVALLDARDWARLDCWLTDIEVVDALVRSVQLGHGFYGRLVHNALQAASNAPAAAGEVHARVLRLPRLCAFVLLCKPTLGPAHSHSAYVLPWEPLPVGAPFQATRARGTHCVHVGADLRWRCFDKPFRDLSGARLLAPHRWRRPHGGHQLMLKPQAAAAAAGVAVAVGQADEEPMLPAVVRQLRMLRTLHNASFHLPMNDVAMYKLL